MEEPWLPMPRRLLERAGEVMRNFHNPHSKNRLLARGSVPSHDRWGVVLLRSSCTLLN